MHIPRVQLSVLSLGLFGALVLAQASPCNAQSLRFQSDRGRGSGIQFVSNAPLETMRGRSSALRGHISLDPTNLSAASGRFRVPVSTLRTGIDLRDEHLRGDGWLDAARFPNVELEIVRISGAGQLREGQRTRVQIHGRFTLHGVSREVVANATIELHPPLEDGRRRITGRASFQVRLTNHNISVPLPVRLKVARDIRVNVRLQATTRASDS